METQAALKMYFEVKRKTSRGFSLRSLARRLQVSPSFLSRVLNGKKALPSHLRHKLAKALDVEPELLGPETTTTSVTSAVDEWEIAEPQSKQILRNWYYIPILELVMLSNFDGELESIARRLGLSLTTVGIAVRELVDLGLLKQVDGRHTKTKTLLRFTSATSLHLIRQFHDAMLTRAREELRLRQAEEDFERRLIIGITVTAAPEKVQEAKRRLAECLYEIANDLMSAPGTEVYHIALQLLPLTKGE
jgi:uncharacterized protein (TIGR02147 family)